MANGTVNYSRGGERTWIVLVAALLFALLTHALPLLFFRPLEKLPATVETGRRFTVMVGHEPTPSDDPYDLYYWLHAGDPMDFTRSDYEHGFSSYLRVREDQSMKLLPIPPLAVSLTRDYADPVNRFFPSSRTPEELMPELRPFIYPPGIRQTGKKALPHESSNRPLWTMADGTEIGDLFADSPDIMRHIIRSAPTRGTVLQLTPSNEEELPPQIKVVQSCGDTNLDIQAAGALAAYAGAGLSAEQLNRLKYVIVDWRATPAGKRKEAEKP